LKKLVFVFILVVTLLGFGFLPVPANAAPLIIVNFPNPVGTTASEIPVKITIPDPERFGYPRVPVEMSLFIAGYRQQGVHIPLLLDIDLLGPESIYEFLKKPIVSEINLPLPVPVRKPGFYRVIVDVKCFYGPNYITSYWYSYTANYSLQIVPERIHVVGVIQKGNYIKALGYSFTQAQIYDFERKGVSFNFGILVLRDGRILYLEPHAEVGTVWDRSEIIEQWLKNEEESLIKEYGFLLDTYPEGKLKIVFEITGEGDWRWLFSNLPESWIEKYGVVIEAALPTVEGISYFPGLSKIEWPGYRWNPIGEFQLELLPVGIP